MIRPNRTFALTAAVLMAAACVALSLIGPVDAWAAACSPSESRSPASVDIDSPRPLTRVNGPTHVVGTARSLPADPLVQIELYADNVLVSTQAVSGSEVEFDLVWDPATAGPSGRTALRVVACGDRAYGNSTVVVTTPSSAPPTTRPTPPSTPIGPTTTTSTTAPSPSTTTTTTPPSTTSTTIIRASTTTTVKSDVVAPRVAAGQDSGSLRAVQPPSRVRRAVTSEHRSPLWPAAVTLGAGAVGLAVAVIPGRRWLGLGAKPGEDTPYDV